MTDAAVTDSPVKESRFSIRARIAILAASAVALVVVLTLVAVFFTLKTQLNDQFEDELLIRAQAAVGAGLGDPETIVQLPSEAFGESQWSLLTFNGQLFIPRGGVEPPISDSELAVHQGQADSSIRSVQIDGQGYAVVAVPAGGGATLMLTESANSVNESTQTLALLLILIGITGVLGALVVGYAVARAGLRPVGELTEATERVARTGELRAIPVRSDDELGRLAQSFNIMLTSLDAARDRERQLVADAGHELRTPLTSIRTNLDLLAQSESTQVALPELERESLLADVRTQLTELSSLIDDLVQLSQGTPSTSVRHVDFVDVIERAVDRVRPRGHGITFEVSLEPWWVHGDPAPLERSVTNLLDNAAKWSPPSGVVVVHLSDGVLTVTDSGPGIPEGDQRKVFERFYRSDEARGAPGSGLGLAIVAQTIAQHGGTVSASNANTGGALLTVTLPGTKTLPDAKT